MAVHQGQGVLVFHKARYVEDSLSIPRKFSSRFCDVQGLEQQGHTQSIDSVAITWYRLLKSSVSGLFGRFMGWSHGAFGTPGLFSAEEVAVVHVMNRVVRRCFLLGDDPLTRKSYDHRKTWIEDQLRLLASHFGIDLLGFAIPSNHFHLMLRSRPDCIEARDDAEFARRWLMRCPVRKDAQARRASERDGIE